MVFFIGTCSTQFHVFALQLLRKTLFSLSPYLVNHKSRPHEKNIAYPTTLEKIAALLTIWPLQQGSFSVRLEQISPSGVSFPLNNTAVGLPKDKSLNFLDKVFLNPPGKGSAKKFRC
jgi:hypothetical protein